MNKYGRIADLQQMLNAPPSTCYDLIARGQIAAFRIGKAIRVDLEDAARFIEENRIGRTLADVAEA